MRNLQCVCVCIHVHTYNVYKGYMCVSGRHETCAVLSLVHDILDYEDQYCCLQGAAVETLCKTGHHVRVQIDSTHSIWRFRRLTTPSKGVHTTQGMDAADARIELRRTWAVLLVT